MSANKPAADSAATTTPTPAGSGLIASPAVQRATGMPRAATAMAVALADGRRVNVECWPGHGAPLVLLHGLLDCAAGWKHLAQATHRPCYAVDLPGFGDSDRPTRNRISAYAEDVQGALAALDVHDFTLVGHSLGGAVATGLAERLRDDVSALVLMAPAGFGRIRVAEAIGPAGRAQRRPSRPAAGAGESGDRAGRVHGGRRQRASARPRTRRAAAQERLPLGAGRTVRQRGDHGVGALPARASTAASSTTTGRCWRCGATATGSSRSLTATAS